MLLLHVLGTVTKMCHSFVGWRERVLGASDKENTVSILCGVVFQGPSSAVFPGEKGKCLTVGVMCTLFCMYINPEL